MRTVFTSLALLSSVAQAFFLPGNGRVKGFRYPLAMSTKSLAEKVLANPQWPPAWPYSEQDFSRMDETDDAIFYDSPRLCYHIDDVSGHREGIAVFRGAIGEVEMFRE